MSAGEQLWFVISIAGFLLLAEGTITLIAREVFKKKPIPEGLLKVTAGVIIFAFAFALLIF